ncbi:MAG: hypothetical protein EOO06_07600 [Chitinophagaceae bacterium]|nr:MAG: hypothetical protein EOO06_07600 [Chitinophagaceae bacterium]
MKHIFILALSVLLLFSCAKKSDNNKPYYDDTSLHKVIDGQYITLVGDTTLYVKYFQFDQSKDCSKEVFNAAIETVSKVNTGINRVFVEGKTLTMRFSRTANANPSRYSLTRESELYQQVHKPWKWQGYLTIKKENSFLTEDEFNKAININVRGVFTGDEAKVISKTILGDFMTVVYELTEGNDDSDIYYEVKANTPITFKSEYLVDCAIPVYAEQGKFVELAPGYTTYAKKDLGNGVVSYSLQISNDWVIDALSNYVATQYFVDIVYPVVK